MELQLLTTSLSRCDMVMMRRDWNARIGHDTVTINSVIGKLANGVQCANGKWKMENVLLNSMNPC